MAASTMFYFEEDEKVNSDNELRSNRLDSISSRSTLSSTGSSPTRSRENLAVPQFVDSQDNSVASTPIACSVTPTPPIDVNKTKKGGKSSSANGGKKTPTKVSGSPNVKRVRTRRADTISRSTFDELYKLSPQVLGRGAYAHVLTCSSVLTGKEYAVKVIEKRPGHSRSRIIKEIETFNLCKDHPNIVQLVEFFEQTDKFYLIFEKMSGGPLLNHIQRRVYFTEQEAALITRDIANALKYLHDRGIAHRDVKPENILCQDANCIRPVKLCDLDLASKADNFALAANSIKTPELRSPVGSAEFMAPEVVDAFVGESLRYDKRCDMWSLGVIIYIMLCGYPPFYGECGRMNCGWNEGEHCSDCQESLFQRIQVGQFDFPSEDWARISDKAQDLIKHLLVKDAKQRYTADDVLKHPWLNEEAPKTPLQTPDVLLRNDSARDLHTMQENFNALGRMGGAGVPAYPIARLSNTQQFAAYINAPGRDGILTIGRSNTPPMNALSLSQLGMRRQTPVSCITPTASTINQRPSDDGVVVRS